MGFMVKGFRIYVLNTGLGIYGLNLRVWGFMVKGLGICELNAGFGMHGLNRHLWFE